MPEGIGVLSKAGIKACTSWGESWSAVNEQIPFNDESIKQQIEWNENNCLEGSAGRRSPDGGLIKIDGPFKADFDYYNFDTLLEMALGAAAGTVFTIADDLSKIFRMEIEKSVSRWRYDGAMIDMFSLTGEKGKIVGAEFGLACRSLARSATAFPTLSITNMSRVRFSVSAANSRIRIADQADALASGDEVGWEYFKLTLQRKLKKDDGTNQSRYVLQPKIDGFREVKLEIRIPRYSADTYQDWKDAATLLQSDLYFTDGTRSYLIEIPEMKIEDGFDAGIKGPGEVPLEGSFGCFRNSSNTPMSAVTNEFRITRA